MQWYATLIDKKNSLLANYLNQIRLSFTDIQENDVEMSSPEDEGPAHGGNQSAAGEADNQGRPSEYLRSHCPLCFGGKDWKKTEDLVDFIVCLDACFKQKSRKAQGKEPPAPRQHPETIFISSADVKSMEDKVETVRPQGKPKGRDTTKQTAPSDADADHCEPGIQVPNSVLNMCEDSFTAADEKRVKASTQFFSDTGIMALLC
ncbi:uncharacterized protein LACBIDRAFT_296503 [Laccaria bicolor S238N-H82]|uniref:Predicted protein n=1 Tax=Laccaria bicolor (strain S238N-H82 / ATCC MYA-4686) TaxID=486041 RepID=B0D8Z6_LACBS|nr:uncharacterized protein LACBIDRAFT_296503 [Laccaria bicolor S238N-H82]EDR09164.1 predicted protein [Laccaria bicolor S238N-H82]|eukprot:XP_001880477.1 predicted protein [Laccaria bicolor S238N-H82]